MAEEFGTNAEDCGCSSAEDSGCETSADEDGSSLVDETTSEADDSSSESVAEELGSLADDSSESFSEDKFVLDAEDSASSSDEETASTRTLPDDSLSEIVTIVPYLRGGVYTSSLSEGNSMEQAARPRIKLVYPQMRAFTDFSLQSPYHRAKYTKFVWMSLTVD